MPHEPKKRHSRARQGKRRASIKLNIPGFAVCSNCKDMTLPHTVRKKCGFYNGRQVLTLKKNTTNGGKKIQTA